MIVNSLEEVDCPCYLDKAIGGVIWIRRVFLEYKKY